MHLLICVCCSNTLRKTRAVNLGKSDADRGVYLGSREKNFAFDQLKHMRIDFVECCTVGNGNLPNDSLRSVCDWLDTVT